MSLRGGLNLIVLKLLFNESLTGSELVNRIENLTGSWRPSPGSIYPLLNNLTEKGLVCFKQNKNQKKYSITLKGKLFYIKGEVTKKKIISELREGVNFLKNLGEDAKECIKFEDMIKNLISEGEFVYLNSSSEIHELRNTLVDAIKSKKDTKKISKILKECTKKIKNLK